jgi:hypothetical protein
MLQIVYISTARHVFTKEELDGVLLKSRVNNGRVGVTGLLVCGGKRFLQVLEGPEEAVAATYERIKADPRHFAMVPLSIKQVEKREFGAWSMGYEAGRAPGDGDLRQVVAQLVQSIRDRNLAAQFTGFAELHARAA